MDYLNWIGLASLILLTSYACAITTFLLVQKERRVLAAFSMIFIMLVGLTGIIFTQAAPMGSYQEVEFYQTYPELIFPELFTPEPLEETKEELIARHIDNG